jgi:uncharacterized protein YdaU (DUF1376 family)
MRFYRHDPDAWLAGTAELNFEQRGAYISLIDLLYSRDGIVPDDDRVVARMLQVDPRTWRRLKYELMAAAKVRTTPEGNLTANRVAEEQLRAEIRSKLAIHSVNVRWQRFKNAKENNGPNIQGRNTPIRQYKNNSEVKSNARACAREEPPQEVADGSDDDTFGAIKAKPQLRPDPQVIQISDELAAHIQRKWSNGGG